MNDKKLVSMFREGLISYQKLATSAYLQSKEISAFFPMVGARYKKERELMIVGRATNGWLKGNDYSAKTLGNPAVFEEMWNEVFAHTYPDDPMALIKHAWNTEEEPFWRSAFFRVAKKTLLKLEVVDEANEDWASYLIWTNLYKVSPYSGKNPGERMARAQEPWCYDFLKAEIALYKPKRILFMTGRGWASPFLGHLGFKERLVSKGDCIELCGQIEWAGGHKVNAVVIPHPQGKSECEPVEQAVDCFRQLLQF